MKRVLIRRFLTSVTALSLKDIFLWVVLLIVNVVGLTFSNLIFLVGSAGADEGGTGRRMKSIYELIGWQVLWAILVGAIVSVINVLLVRQFDESDTSYFGKICTVFLVSLVLYLLVYISVALVVYTGLIVDLRRVVWLTF